MAKERPQLSLDELHRLRWGLGGVLALVAIWSIAFLEVNAWAMIFTSTVAIALTLWKTDWPAYFSRWVNRLAFPAAVTFFIVDFYVFSELLPAFVRLGILLVAFRACTYRQRRDDLQLILVALLLVITTGVLTVSIAFAAQIILTAGLALSLLLTRTLLDANESATGRAAAGVTVTGRAPNWTQLSWRELVARLWVVSDWRVGVAAGVLFVALVAFSGALFLAIPRYQLENSLFLDRWMNKKSVTGFSDTLHFGDVSDIEKDDSVAFRVEVSDVARLPAELYWRMIVLDEYHDRAFRLSTYERDHSFSREITFSRIESVGFPIRANNVSWTFYIEPGVSRFLPLTGGFMRLTFTEPQSFQVSKPLRIVALARDPSTMKAYRVDNMDTTGTLQTRRAIVDPSLLRLIAPPPTVELPFDDAQRDRWSASVREIDPDHTMTAAQFSAAAIKWLHHRHNYSLHSVIPGGAEEPLLRWVLSNQPGHCELFAGAFTMLARAEGFPCRVVAGFLGGEWNGDYLIVRNSHAHAWCELLDSAGNWVRVDPTAASTNQSGASVDPVSDFDGRALAAQGWSAQWDRLRMLWYRHIVNFDQQDQIALVKTLQGTTDSSVHRLQVEIQRLREFWRQVLRGPWNWARWRAATEGLGVMGLTIWLVYRLTHAVSTSGWAWRRRKADPIRAEAGRWLAKLARKEIEPKRSAPSCASSEKGYAAAYPEIHDALIRIRFARRETWPDIAATFRNARKIVKRSRNRRVG